MGNTFQKLRVTTIIKRLKVNNRKVITKAPRLWCSTFNPARLVKCSKWRDPKRPKPSLYVKPIQGDIMTVFQGNNIRGYDRIRIPIRWRHTRVVQRSDSVHGHHTHGFSWLSASSVFLGNNPSFLVFKGGIVIISTLCVFCEN